MHRIHHEPSHRTWAEIDASALKHNASIVRSRAGGRAALIAVVKANAYGHGIVNVVPALAEESEMFAVANLNEALEVRAVVPDHPVLLLGPAAPNERPEVLAHGFIPLISSGEEAAAYSQLSRTGRAPVHLKLDTGMGRVGVWYEEAPALARELHALHGISVTGIASHLPAADEDEEFTRGQITTFLEAARKLREEEGLGRAKVHLCNSAGALGYPEGACDLIRVGLALYGSSPQARYQPELRQALTWKARITLVRDVPAGRSISYGRTFITPRPMRLATLAVGYADGYPRSLSGQNGDVLVKGRRCALIGRVTMDQIIVDVSALETVTAGDEAVLLGRQDEEEILASDLAAKAGTIAWEIFTRIGTRVVRVPLDRSRGPVESRAA